MEYTIVELVGLKVRSLRINKGLTQEELGKRVGLHRTYIGCIERGEKNISVDTIGILCKEFGIEPKDFFDFSKLE